MAGDGRGGTAASVTPFTAAPPGPTAPPRANRGWIGMRAVSRDFRDSRHEPPPLGVYERGRLRIDFDAYEVWVDGQKVHLSLRCFRLLCFFVRFPNRVFNRRTILDQVWGTK